MNISLESAGNDKGVGYENPMLDALVYEVMFPDGAIRQYSANIIAENMYSQFDEVGNTMTLFDSIICHRRNDTIKMRDSLPRGGISRFNGRTTQCNTFP